jgi:hypothetical protein
MACVVAPFDQVFPVALEEVNTTEPPAQNVVEPPAVMVGIAGKELTVTTVAVELALQFPLETVTEYDPLCETVIDCVVAPLDQVLPVALEEVKTTEPPEQKVVEPPAVIMGVVRVFVIETVVTGEVELHAPFVITTE